MFKQTCSKKIKKTFTEKFDIIKDFYCFTDNLSGVDCYLISKENFFSKCDPHAISKIVNDCETVQDLVWNKKYNTFHNTFHQDYVVLYIYKDQIIGFMSGSSFQCDNFAKGAYYSDGMILPLFRGKKLSNLAYALILNEIIDSSPAHVQSFVNLIISGHLALFKFFENNKEFTFINISKMNLNLRKTTLKKLREDFPKTKLSENGIMREAWLKQSRSKYPVWEKEEIKKMHFPGNVSYENGDVLVRNYIIERKDKNFVSEFINERKT